MMSCFKMILFVLLTFFFQLGLVTAQSKSINLQIKILNERKEPLQDCSLKIISKSESRVITYKSFGAANSFLFKLTSVKVDTLEITTSHTGYYDDTTILFVQSGQSYIAELVLKIKPKELQEIIVGENWAQWKKGDTTFFNPNSFKEPGQRKLAELISNIPGFTKTDNGLIYKNNPVQKITIDGEELFADKIDLLLANFPIHVIQNLQAIENQSSNPKLNGVTDEKNVTLNLSIKKENKKVTFGDAEAGLGTNKRYLVNPVLFKISSKIKFGLISNFNNYGQKLSYNELLQTKGEQYMSTENGSINSAITTINEFSSSRYLRNNLFNTQLQINSRINKKINSKTDFSFIADKQKQNISDSSSIFSDNEYIFSNSAHSSVLKPTLFKISEYLDIDLTKKSVLQVSFSVIKDIVLQTESEQVLQKNLFYESQSKIKNNWLSFSGKLKYTKRISINKAFQFKAEYGHFNFPQEIMAISPNWQKLFNLPDTAYKNFNQYYLNKSDFLKTNTSVFIKTKKRLINYNLNIDYKRVQLSSNLNFNSANSTLPEIAIPGLSNSGVYETGKISTNLKYGFKMFKQPFYTIADAGFYFININESNKQTQTVKPAIEITLGQRHNFGNKLQSEFKVAYKTNSQEIYKLHSNIFPVGIAQFQNFNTPFTEEKSYSASNSLYFTFKNSRLRLTQLISFNLTPPLYQQSYTGILSYSTISVTGSQPTYFYFASIEYAFPVVFLGSKVTISNNIFTSSRLIQLNSEIKKTNTTNNNISLKIQRNWNKKYFLTLKSGVEIYAVKLPGAVQNQSFKTNTNLVNGIILKGILFKTYSCTLSIDHYKNKITQNSPNSILFSDFEIVKNIEKRKLSLRFKAENIFNQKQFIIVERSSPLFQYYSTLPLIGRNIFVSIRREL